MFLCARITLIGRHQILNVDKRVLPTIFLENVQRFHDQFSQIQTFLLPIVNAITRIYALIDKDIQYW